ncbi:MAG: SIR2 family protein [Pyrinomonadaceae bacterium]
MPIDLTKIPDLLKEAAASSNLVPFIGAGISRQAKTTGKPLPTWREFIVELKNFARDDDSLSLEDEEQIDELVEHGKFLMAAQALKEMINENKLELLIQKRFTSTDAEPGLIHHALFNLRPHLIMTTNYDLLLEDAYAKRFGHNTSPVTPKDSFKVQQVLKNFHKRIDSPTIFKIHGTASEPKEIVFAEKDYRKLIYGDPGYRAVLSAVFVTKVVLMLGFSFSDPEITMVLQTLREGFRERSTPDFIVLRKGVKKRIERRRLSSDFGLEVIEYEPSEGEPELLELVEYLATFAPVKVSTVV